MKTPTRLLDTYVSTLKLRSYTIIKRIVRLLDAFMIIDTLHIFFDMVEIFNAEFCNFSSTRLLRIQRDY